MENKLNIRTIFVGIITVILVCAVLKIMSSVFIPFVLAIFFALIFKPLLDVLEDKLNFPNFLAILISVLLVLVLVYGFIYFITNTVSTFALEYPKYQDKFLNVYSTLEANLGNILTSIYAKFGIEYTDKLNLLSLTDNFKWQDLLGNTVKSISGSAVNLASSIGVIFILVIFLLFELDSVKGKLLKGFGNSSDKIHKIFENITTDVVSYLSLKTLLSLVTGVLVYISMKIIGLDFAILWAVFAFAFNFIPTIGSIIFCILVSIFGFAQFFPNWGAIMAVIICAGAIEFIIGNVIDPMVLGDRLQLSPFVVLFSLFFWNWLWGPVGMFLSVPLVMVIKIICKNIPELTFVSVLIGNNSDGDIRKESLFKKSKKAFIYKIHNLDIKKIKFKKGKK